MNTLSGVGKIYRVPESALLDMTDGVNRVALRLIVVKHDQRAQLNQSHHPPSRCFTSEGAGFFLAL